MFVSNVLLHIKLLKNFTAKDNPHYLMVSLDQESGYWLTSQGPIQG